MSYIFYSQGGYRGDIRSKHQSRHHFNSQSIYIQFGGMLIKDLIFCVHAFGTGMNRDSRHREKLFQDKAAPQLAKGTDSTLMTARLPV